jgi:hypothetical protein
LKSKPAFKWVEIDGLGRVGIRGISHFKYSRRIASYRDANWQIDPEKAVLSDLHLVIDQLMETETEPMFKEADIEEVGELDSVILGNIITAIKEFNGDLVGNE